MDKDDLDKWRHCSGRPAVQFNNVIPVILSGFLDETVYSLTFCPLGEDRVEGIYPYVTSPRTETNAASKFADTLLLNGSNDAYPNGPNYYLNIAKDSILQELKWAY